MHKERHREKKNTTARGICVCVCVCVCPVRKVSLVFLRDRVGGSLGNSSRSPDLEAPSTSVLRRKAFTALQNRTYMYIYIYIYIYVCIDKYRVSHVDGWGGEVGWWGRIFVKGTTGLLWHRSCVSSAQHGHDLAASSSSTDVRRSYLCAVLALVLVQRAVGRLLLRFRGRSRWYCSS